MSIQINADSIGERVVVALAVLGLIVEVVADPNCNPRPAVTVEQCQDLCAPYAVEAYGHDSCSCAIPENHPDPDEALAAIYAEVCP